MPVLSPFSALVARRSRRRSGRRGFTLLELLVATVITAVLAGFIVTIVSNVSGFWSRTTGRLSTEAQARHILDQLSLDLGGAQFRDDGNVWMAADVLPSTTNSGFWQAAVANPKPTGTGTNGSIAMTSASLADARFGPAGVWLRFFTTKRGSNLTATPATFSAPVAVGYQIIRRFSAASTVSTKTAYLFHRAEVRPAGVGTGSTLRPGVLETGYTITSGPYSNVSTATNTGTTTGDPRSIQAPGSRTNFDSVIGENVIDFGVRCYVREVVPSDSADPTSLPATRLRLVFPAGDAAGALTNSTSAPLRAQLPGNTPSTDPSYNYRFLMPDVVDVMVRILTDEGARLLDSYERANSPLTVPAGLTAQQYWWQIAAANSQVYTRRVVLNTKPL